MKRQTPASIEQDIDALRLMDAKALRARWREVLKTEPPKMQAGFLRLAIAYRLQERLWGGIKPEAARQLRKLAKTIGTESSTVTVASKRSKVVLFDPQTSLSPGTRLMREWNGATELVEVVVGGFVWRGRPFKTLSAVAVAITGTKWSGPKFFGLLARKPSAAQGRAKAQSLSIPVLEDQAA